MTTKKQHIDPNAKRDFGVLNSNRVEQIKDWLTKPEPSEICPFYGCRLSWPTKVTHKKIRKICTCLFPETKGKRVSTMCPCTILYVSDVKKVARQAIQEWEKNHD